MRRSLLPAMILLALCATGCKKLKVRHVDESFTGVKQALERSGTVSMFLVHGMGGYYQDDPQPLIRGVASELKLREVNGSETVRWIHLTDELDSKLVGKLFRRDYHRPETRHSLRVYWLEWKQASEPVKFRHLAYDKAMEYEDRRLRVHHQAKQALLNNNLADVVLYLGSAREQLQYPLRKSLLLMQEDGGAGEIVCVTFSLGSRMLIDVLRGMGKSGDPAEAAACSSFCARITSFFMLANQLPLLELGSVTIGEPKSASQETGGPAPSRPLHELLQRTGRRAREESSLPPMTVVTISDPNDFLSYPIPEHVGNMYPGMFVNVALSISSKAYLIPSVGYVTDPVKAHGGHGTDAAVIDMITRGAKKAHDG